MTDSPAESGAEGGSDLGSWFKSLRAEQDRELEEYSQDVDAEDYVARLLAAADALRTPSGPFQVGDLVMWKPGLKNKVRPIYGAPAVVLDVLDEPLFDMDGPMSSGSYREPLDLLLGVLDAGELVAFHFDSRRFERFVQPDA